MLLIGDIHGHFDIYKRIIESNDCKESIQVGDFGVGFPRISNTSPFNVTKFLEEIEGNHRFIRGNHDNPEACLKCNDFIKDGHIENDIMFVGGAYSIDKADLIENINWWKDEEVSYNECIKLLDLYEEKKPKIMITHECPEFLCKHIKPNDYYNIKSITRNLFQQMYEINPPDLWVFGHWHVPYRGVHNNCEFLCLDVFQYAEFDLKSITLKGGLGDL